MFGWDLLNKVLDVGACVEFQLFEESANFHLNKCPFWNEVRYVMVDYKKNELIGKEGASILPTKRLV